MDTQPWVELLKELQGLLATILAIVTALVAWWRQGRVQAAQRLEDEKKAWEDAKEQGVAGLVPYVVRLVHQFSAGHKILFGKSMAEKRRMVKRFIIAGIYEHLGPKAAGELTPEALERYADMAERLWKERKNILKGELDGLVDKALTDSGGTETPGGLLELVPGVEAGDGGAEGKAPGPESGPTSTPSGQPEASGDTPPAES